MNERADLISWLRGELVGPAQPLASPFLAQFEAKTFTDPEPKRRGPLAWQPVPDGSSQEVLYYDRETPHRKYGAGLLHPVPTEASSAPSPDTVAAEASDELATESHEEDVSTDEQADSREGRNSEDTAADEFEVTSPDIRHPSTMGISFCVALSPDGEIVVRLPISRRFSWQRSDAVPFALNGRYELCSRHWMEPATGNKDAPIWRRQNAIESDTEEVFSCGELQAGRVVRRQVTMPVGSPIDLRIELFPRKLQGSDNLWLVSVVLRNSSSFTGSREPRESILYQTYFEASVRRGSLSPYPESKRPYDQLDTDEQSLALLYRESTTWAIGHGCAAGWDAGPEEVAEVVYADVMPAVQIPSMTPDISSADGPIELSMRSLASLDEDGLSVGWMALDRLALEYGNWIRDLRVKAEKLDLPVRDVAVRHVEACETCLIRIKTGIRLLREDKRMRDAFRLANLAMLLQQIATKALKPRPLAWDRTLQVVRPQGNSTSPWQIYEAKAEGPKVGIWRAFQIAFMLMSIDGTANDKSDDRETVDLIWFPTGGGKTEAYLAVVAFYMFHQRLLPSASTDLRRDGTNVLMRYTLRMLTTQQFQRAASLVSAMEFLRRHPDTHALGSLSGGRFSLGLWIGSGGSPNKIADAKNQLSAFRRGDVKGNPLILTECPWCRSSIGICKGDAPPKMRAARWNEIRLRGVFNHTDEGPLLLCSDVNCEFGAEQWESWLPVEVIDERIYRAPPSIVIATADKLAMIAYRREAGALFGRRDSKEYYSPPGLIIQDELHLISGPLGTMYAFYEGIFEYLCSRKDGEMRLKPKIIASTATIRGAADQVRSLYARGQTQLFPSPGLTMGDSFFGRYARHQQDNTLQDGRLYLGIHANDYGSILTTQVRAFSAALFRPYSLAPEKRDPWWTLLAFYNSIRELSGARTLFDADIKSRLKFIFNRENFAHDKRRNLRIVDELTSRLSQMEIVEMMDKLSTEYNEADNRAPDACLASNIIEVGVDIERLSLMGVIGQPKTTAQYIQVTGRVGRKWWDRPGLILTVYNPGKSRDRSHFEQFHSYHRRLYERVEPTSATPFALSAIQRALPGALIAWARQCCNAGVHDQPAYSQHIEFGYELLRERCEFIQVDEADRTRSLAELERVRDELLHKWGQNPQAWEAFPPMPDGEYLMLWPGQFATRAQKDRGVVVPTSMRQVDGTGELAITQGYNSIG
jgi:hypothetical protein